MKRRLRYLGRWLRRWWHRHVVWEPRRFRVTYADGTQGGLLDYEDALALAMRFRGARMVDTIEDLRG